MSGSSKPTTSVYSSLLSSVTSSAGPGCLSHAVVKLIVNDVHLDALIDTGSSESYVASSLAHRHGWKVLKSQNKITMANTYLSSHTESHCYTTIEYKGSMYKSNKLSVLPSSSSSSYSITKVGSTNAAATQLDSYRTI